ncbi:MAG: amidohydrolase family protein [Gaiella sp.]
MATIDFHQHLWPDAFIELLRSRRTPPRLTGDRLVTVEGEFGFDAAAHDPERRIEALDRDGVEIALLSLQSTLGVESLPAAEQDECTNAWLDGIVTTVAGSGGRLAALAPGRLREGFAGVSVGASALYGEQEHQVLAEADAVGGVVFVHPEAAVPHPGRPDWWGWTAGYTAQMQAAYLSWLAGGRDRYPRLRLVFAILAGGGPFQHERLAHRGVDVRRTLDPDVLFDTATYGRRAIELCIETFGVECLVYGSDTPVVDPAPTLAAVRGFGDAAAQLVLSDNPTRILT